MNIEIDGKKVVFVLPNLNSGGAERVAINFLRHLSKLEVKCSLILLESRGGLQSAIPHNVDVIEMDVTKVRNAVPVLYKQLFKLNPDVVYTTHSRLTPVIGFIKLFSRYIYIARVPNNPIKELAHGAYGRFRSKLFGWGFRQADAVIAQTAEMKSACEQLYSLRGSTVRVVHNPLDTENINRCIESEASPFRASERPIVALGRLAPQKNFGLLLRAFKIVANENTDARLYILGEDHGEKQGLERMIADLGLDGRVELLGLVSNPYPYIANASIFAMSSDYEGFPNALLESYYLNTPIAATKCCDIVERLITDGENGYLANVGDADGLAVAIESALRIDRRKIKNPLDFLDTDIPSLFFIEARK